VQLTEAERKHLVLWRNYQSWLASLPSGLLMPLHAVRNPNLTAVESKRGKRA
jgi:hypothetical protein